MIDYLVEYTPFGRCQSDKILFFPSVIVFFIYYVSVPKIWKESRISPLIIEGAIC